MNKNDLAALYKTDTGNMRNDEEISAALLRGKVQLLENLPPHKIEEIRQHGSFILHDDDYVEWLESKLIEFFESELVDSIESDFIEFSSNQKTK